MCCDELLDLQLSLPTNTGASVDLRECFREMTKEEPLDAGVECSDCIRSVGKTRGTRRMFLNRIPDVLVVQLGRFQKSLYGNICNKVTTTVTCSTSNVIDMRPFCHPNLPEELPTQYEVFGVAHHVGGLNGGHYEASCRTELDQWHQFNDAQVHPQKANDALDGSSAYVLFLQKLETSKDSRAGQQYLLT